MKKITLLIACFSLVSVLAHSSEKYMGELDCAATLPLIFSSKTTLKLSPSIDMKRTITVRKNKNTTPEKFSANCNIQSSILKCTWKKGKIEIDTTMQRDPGIIVLNTGVGAYNYYNSKITLKRLFIDKVLKFRCRI